MKNLLILTFLFSSLLLISCSKSETDTILTGKWRLSETLADPGDGRGKWENAKSNKMYLIFNTDGTLSGSESAGYKSYTVLDSVKIEFILKNDSKTISAYKISGNSLLITPPCFEACGSRFIKVN